MENDTDETNHNFQDINWTQRISHPSQRPLISHVCFLSRCWNITETHVTATGNLMSIQV